ncbi:MAG: RICIN domain-containing protein [Candidatus Thiothrix sulfatifontis]|nr:MAG: RICIN domain-containing protein [Candidatus Thiothrix sulfatifontis]
MAKLKVNHGKQYYLAVDNDMVIQSKSVEWEFKDISGGNVDNPALVGGFVRIIHKNTGKCLQPENLPPLEAGKRRTLLAPTQTGNQSQLWCFTPVANRQGWYFIENHMKENDDEERCLDVCCRSEESGTSVITYHKKQVRSQTIGNQWWMIEYTPIGSALINATK